MDRSFLPRRRLLVAGSLVVVALGGLGIAGADLQDCATPIASAPSFARGDENTLSWTQPTGSQQGGGFVIEVANAPATDPDGSFVDANLVQTAAAGATARSYDFENLPEQALSYHLYAKEKVGSCAPRSEWSDIVSTAQDATAPSATITTGNQTIFLLEAVSVDGTASDEPGPDVPASSGPKIVRVSLANTTPVLGPIFLQPPRQDATVNPDGTWNATFQDVRPGTYVVSATAFDHVGNPAAAPVSIAILVVNPPS